MGIGFFLLYHWRRQLFRRFVHDSLFSQLAPDSSAAKRFFKQSLLLLATASLILAIANPEVGTRYEEVKREGIDLFVALDVSLSMKAEDVRPRRLEKAKRDISDLLRKLRGDRVGLIVFAGDAFVQFPLTADYSAADLFISAVDVETVPTPGTMIGSAIEMALRSFRTDLPTQKAIIIASDGENTEGDIAGAIEHAKKERVRIYAIGMGTPEGSPIPMYDAAGIRTDYKRDRAGNIVLSRLEESTLQQIALATDGSYRRATSAGNEIDDVYKELSSLQKTEMGSMQVTGFEDQFHYPLGLAILLLILESSISERRGRLLKRFTRLIPPAGGLLILSLIIVSTARSQTVRSHIKSGNEAYEKSKFPDAEVDYKKALVIDAGSREAKFNLGNADYKQQRFDEAQRNYNTTIATFTDPIHQSMGYYNLGNALFRSNKIEESVEAYKRALRLNPTDEDARYNYQLAKDRLKQQNQQQQGNQNKQDKNQQDKQSQQQQNNSQQQNQKDQQRDQPQPEQAKQDRTQQQAQAQQQKNQMPKEQADRILEALRNNEKELQKQLRKRRAARVYIEKDW
jgi:Ca-activated chloride channel family protein